MNLPERNPLPDATPMTRRAFLGAAAAALLAGAVVRLTGCSYDSAYGGGGGSGDPVDGKQGSISANHGHKAVITQAELDDGGALTLHIAGSAGHDHIVDLSGDEVTAIRSGTVVAKPSTTTNGHAHTVTFN